jgi:hypothetical protein
MLAQVTTLRHWKSEHTVETCEDAVGENSASGLFAVADGAGTTLFSGAWADFLVRHFLSVPLLDNDPFEVEWWVRLAQEEFKQAFPTQTDLAWNAQQKVQSQGSYSTLATLRISAQGANHVQAEILAMGDSCVILYRPALGEPLSFPLQRPEEFEQAPICIPSKPGVFNRYFHQFQAITLDLAPADIVVLATDAVAKWIVGAGNGRYASPSAALQDVVSQTAESWPAFIQNCRAHGEMLDDDSTILLLTLQPDDAITGSRLGITTGHSQQVRVQRKQDFLQAVADDNKERVALYYGTGADLRAEGITISAQEFSQAREVADALREVLALLREVVNSSDVVPIMTEAWQKHGRLLYQEPCAAPVRATLVHLGVPIELRTDIALMETAALPVYPAHPSSEDNAADEESSMLMTQVFKVQPPQHPVETNHQTEEE